MAVIFLEKSENVNCQSCAMPMKLNEDFGTNRDSSKNKEYCSFCFKEGRFTDEGITLERKIANNILIAKEMGIPEDKTKRIAENIIPKLKRWQNKWVKDPVELLKITRCVILKFHSQTYD